MGWLRSLSKGFIRFFELAKKKIFSKGVYFILVFTSAELDRIQNDHIAPPPALPAGRASSLIPPPSRMVVFGWLLCVLASFGVLFRPRRIFLFYYLSINSTAGRMTWRHPTRSAQVGSLLHRFPHRLRQLFFDCCVVPQKSDHQGQHPVSLSLFFDSINSPPQTMG